jgi:vacuolar-type H+-ATPase subunit I/STV1
MGIGFVLMGVAMYMFFFAESFTFYTPYSVESGGWILHLPNGIDYSINSYVGISTMIGSAILGVLLLMLSSALKIRLRLKMDDPKKH